MVATLIVVVMVIMAIPFLFKLSAQYRSSERGARALRAFNLAEAGVDKVMWNINLDWTNPYDPALDPERIVWSLDHTTGTISDISAADAEITGDVAVTLGLDPDPGGFDPVTRPLESMGMVGFIADRTVDRTVRVILEKYFGSVWDYGFYVERQFRIENTQLTVDSYDSREANYDPRNPGDLGFFAINNYEEGSFVVDQGGGGTIDVTGAIAAGGKLISENDPPVYPDGEMADAIIDLPKNAEDDVAQVPMEQPFLLPPVNLFDLHPKETWPSPNSISNWFTDQYVAAGDGTALPASGDIKPEFINDSFHLDGTQTITDSFNGVYESFEIAAGGELFIEGDVTILVTGFADSETAGQFIMETGSNIRINPESSLTLILGNTSFYMAHQTTINVPIVDNTADMVGQDTPGFPTDCIILGMNAFAPDTNYVQEYTTATGDLDRAEGRAIQNDPTLSPPGVIIFEQQVDISAAIYTPLSTAFDIQGMNHADIYGAWIADAMFFKVAAAFHYDEALGDIMMIRGGPPKWRIISWQEKVGN